MKPCGECGGVVDLSMWHEERNEDGDPVCWRCAIGTDEENASTLAWLLPFIATVFVIGALRGDGFTMLVTGSLFALLAVTIVHLRRRGADPQRKDGTP